MTHISIPTAARADDGTAIAYRTRGTGPVDVLFMHGWAGSGANFQETLKYLDLTGVRVIAVDLRGHGDSDKPEGTFSLDRVAQDILAVADHLDSARFVVVGFSMSAKFAQYLACIAPGRVRGQMLVSGCPTGEIPFPAETHQAPIPGARLVLLDANHEIPVERPRELAGLLEAFLAGLRPD